MCAISGWLAVSAQSRVESEVPFGESAEYPRVEIAWNGSPEMETDTIPRLIGQRLPSTRRGMVPNFGGIYSAPTDGYCLLYFRLHPIAQEMPKDIPAEPIALTFNHEVILALNYSLLNECVSELQIERGDYVGKVNCQNLTAAARLAVANGKIVARASLAPARKRKAGDLAVLMG